MSEIASNALLSRRERSIAVSTIRQIGSKSTFHPHACDLLALDETRLFRRMHAKDFRNPRPMREEEPDRWLLRGHSERPRRRAADCRDEIAPSHVSVRNLRPHQIRPERYHALSRPCGVVELASDSGFVGIARPRFHSRDSWSVQIYPQFS